MNNRGLLGPWKGARKLVLGASILVAISLFAIPGVPLGLVALGELFLLSHIWRDLIVTDPTAGSYIPGTRPYKVATFFMALKPMFVSHLTNVYQMGFGPGMQDTDHGYEPSFFPMTRLSSWYSAVLALLLCTVDYALASLHVVVVPFGWIIGVPLSAIGWFLTFQIIWATFATQGDRETVMSVEPKPQVMLSAVRSPQGGIDVKSIAIKAGAIAGSAVLVTLLIALSAGAPWWVTLTLIIVEVLFSVLLSMSRDLQKQYVAQWEERKERRAFWEGVWGFMRPEQVPQLLGESDLPTLDEWARSHTDTDGNVAPYDPSVKIAVLSIPMHQTFNDYVGHEARLIGAIPDCKMVSVAPVGVFDENNNEVIGTVGSQAFRVWYSVKEAPKLFDKNVDSRMRELMCRSRIVDSLRNIRTIGECTFYKSVPVTTPDSEIAIIGVQVHPQNSSVNLVSFLKAIPDIQQAIGAKWVRVMASPEKNAPPGTILMYIAEQEPHPKLVSYISPASIEQGRIDKMSWTYTFYATGVVGTNGYPEYVEREKSTDIVDKITFVLPDGIEMDDVTTKGKKIASTSGNTFLEINERAIKLQTDHASGPGGRKGGAGKRRTSRKMLEQQIRDGKQQFTVIASKIDPINRPFLFSDYSDRLLFPRQKYKARLEWAAGVLADDELAIDGWESASGSHLLVAGQSGSGKSVTMTDMNLQLIHNNGPGELNMWMIEPKNEMQVYRNCDVVTRFLDSFSPGDFMTNAADMMTDLVDEMNRRNQVMTSHPKAPKKLSKAREIAITESKANGTPIEDHPLYMPFIIMIVEECATLFAEASGKEEKAEQARLIAQTTEIARKARSAGIYLVCATQYPTNASIPSVIRQQMRRIGMKCRDSISSQVVINEPGLEKIKVLGAGKMEPKGMYDYRMFRSFFAKDGDPDKGEENDIFAVLEKVPTKMGMTPAQMSGEERAAAFVMPDIGETVFSKFSQGAGTHLQAAIDSGMKTKDIVGI